MTDTADRITDATPDPTTQWHTTACILCSNNCGIEVRLDGREITRVRGNKRHVGSKGYTCEKALRVNHYQEAVIQQLRNGPIDFRLTVERLQALG